MMALIWIAIIVAVIFAVRYFARQTHRTGQESSALEILKARYARGEINKEEFEEKRKAVQKAEDFTVGCAVRPTTPRGPDL
jgi:putative membrane protein